MSRKKKTCGLCGMRRYCYAQSTYLLHGMLYIFGSELIGKPPDDLLECCTDCVPGLQVLYDLYAQILERRSLRAA